MPKIKIVSLPKHQVDPIVPTQFQQNTGMPQGVNIWQSGMGIQEPQATPFDNTSSTVTGIQGQNPYTIKTDPFQQSTANIDEKKYLFPTTQTTTIKQKSNIFNTLSDIGYGISAGLAIGSTWASINEMKDKQRWLESQKRKQMFTGMVDDQTNRGNIETNTGKQAPNLGAQNYSFYGMYGKYGGEFNSSSKKVMIDEVPDYVKMAYGGQTKYGLNIARTDSPYGVKPVPHAPDHVTNTVSETKTNEPKKLEAEKGEYLWKVGDGTIHYIDGKKHYDGGTKLTSSQVDSSEKPEVSSFIFSDHLKLPSELVKTNFNYDTSKRKVSPAEVAGKYELNKYQAILDSKNSDKLDKTTAQLMVDKNTKQLAKLAVIHEAIKGEQPPQFAMEMLGEVPTAKLGGYIQDKYLPHFQTQGTVPPGGQTIDLGTVLGEYNQDYATLEGMLMSKDNEKLRDEMYNKYKSKNPNTNISKDKFFNTFLEAQKHVYAINNLHKDDPDYMSKDEWNRTRDDFKNKLYKQDVSKLGLNPLSNSDIKLFQEAFDILDEAKDDPNYGIGKYFVTEAKGEGTGKHTKRGKAISAPDEIWGKATNRQYFRMRPETKLNIAVPEEKAKIQDKAPGTKYVCIPDERGNGVVRPSTTGIGYDTPEEAKANCMPAKLPPFDFTTPAKMKMLASVAFPPIYEPPLNPFIAGKQQRFWFNDWQAAAQQAQAAGYRAPMETLTAYAAPQGLGSMASRFAGQTADLIGTQIIPQTGQANVAIANQAEAANAQEARRVELFNTAQKEDQRRETAILNQQYRNALSDFVNNAVDTYGLAWTERGDLYDINMLTNYYKDPRSGKTIFKGQPGNIFGAGYSYPGSSSGSGSYASLYNQNLDALQGTNLTDDEKRKKAMQLTDRYFGNDDDDDYETTSKKRKRRTA